ncbi:unnamed protein product, partial [marine sediment metagenome]
DVMLQTKFKRDVAPERIEETSRLTRTLIIKGAKLGQLTRDETIALLIRKNYSPEEAEYIYAIEVEAAASPETPLEYRQLVESYRKSQGMSYEEIPQDILDADRALLDAIKALRKAEEAGASQDEIDTLKVVKAQSRQKYEELATLHNL